MARHRLLRNETQWSNTISKSVEYCLFSTIQLTRMVTSLEGAKKNARILESSVPLQKNTATFVFVLKPAVMQVSATSFFLLPVR